MKKLLSILLLLIVFILNFSCEDETLVKSCDKCLPLYIVYDSNDTISFKYDNNLIIEIKYPNNSKTETFEYNDLNQLIQYNEYYNGDHEEYTVYQYSGENLIKSSTYRNTNSYENLTDYQLVNVEEYENNENGYIIKANSSGYYINYTYDSKGNIIEQEKYIYIDPDMNIGLDYKRTCKYGNNYFYFKDLNLPPNNHYQIINNLTEQKIENYDITGALVNTDILYMNYYAFNEYGYPTHVSKAGKQEIWREYKEIIYKVIE